MDDEKLFPNWSDEREDGLLWANAQALSDWGNKFEDDDYNFYE